MSAATVAVAAVSIASSSTPPQPATSTTQSSMRQFLQKAMTTVRQNTLEELAKMIARDFHSFSIVDDKGFRSLTHGLNPLYVIQTGTLSPTQLSKAYMIEDVLHCKRELKKSQGFA